MKTMKNFAAQQLSKKQMNEVRGGSTGCASDQKRYSCVTTIDGLGVGTTGGICASSRKEAEALALTAQGNLGADFGVECGNPR